MCPKDLATCPFHRLLVWLECLGELHLLWIMVVVIACVVVVALVWVLVGALASAHGI
jgi:hypothetical protein